MGSQGDPDEKRITLTLHGDLAESILVESFRYGIKLDDYLKILLKRCYEERGTISDLRLALQALTKTVLALDERLKGVEDALRHLSTKDEEERRAVLEDLKALREELKALREEVTTLRSTLEAQRGKGLLALIKKLLVGV
jgi:predicted  nucleic acid-binding Zn-ribbon protein